MTLGVEIIADIRGGGGRTLRGMPTRPHTRGYLELLSLKSATRASGCPLQRRRLQAAWLQALRRTTSGAQTLE